MMLRDQRVERCARAPCRGHGIRAYARGRDVRRIECGTNENVPRLHLRRLHPIDFRDVKPEGRLEYRAHLTRTHTEDHVLELGHEPFAPTAAPPPAKVAAGLSRGRIHRIALGSMIDNT